MARTVLAALLTLLSTSQLSSALQVTPNSPCASLCIDSPDLDVSDPNSSTTTNSDITCQDAAFSSAVGTKFKDCMTCLQTSTFSQGSESDTMWFLYNLRYTAAYCVFGYPNATTGLGSTPCTTEAACGRLQASMQHGIQDPSDTSAFSYCSAAGGAAMHFAHFESCVPCVSALGSTEYLANFFVALEAGCRQQPAPGVLLGLNDTVFTTAQIAIVDPSELFQDETEKSGLETPVIVGIVVGGVAALLIVAAVTFVCLRKRRNRRARASAQSEFYTQFSNRPQHRSSMSFQCQTHMVSPRHWPDAAAHGAMPTVAEDHDTPAARSSISKAPEPEHAYTTNDNAAHITKKAAMAAVPLHQISTAMTPVPPPQAYTSPSSAEKVYHSPSDFRSPLSADSTRSTSALLPSIKPYVPAEHGVLSSPTSATSTITPGAGTGMTPLLSSRAWPLPEHAPPLVPARAPSPAPPSALSPSLRSHREHERQAQQQPRPAEPEYAPHDHGHGHADDTAPSLLKTSRSSGLLAMGRRSPRPVGGGGTGSPVESTEIRTAFAAPPRR